MGSAGGIHPRLPSVDVLPFSNLSSEKEQEYFSDGLAEDLLNNLAKIPGLRVVARPSSLQFRPANQDLRNVGEKLDISTVLEGSVPRCEITPGGPRTVSPPAAG